MRFRPEKSWAESAAAYRMRLFEGAGSAGQPGKAVLSEEKIRAVLGSREFVNEVFALHREKFGVKRKDGARPIRALASIGLMALRDLRVRVLG